MSGSRRLGRGLLLGLAFAVSVEGSAWLAEWLVGALGGPRHQTLADALSPAHRAKIESLLSSPEGLYHRHDGELGWVPRPGASHPGMTQNARALRSLHEYEAEPPDGVFRVAAFGDSFVHGDEMDDERVWSARIEELDPSIEVLNFGVGGYALDQAYLRYLRDGVALRPHAVLVGFITDDLNRNVNVFRPFYNPATGLPLAKPRFVVAEHGLRLLPNPLARLEDYRTLLADPDRLLSELGRHDAYAPSLPRASALDALASVRLAKLALRARRPTGGPAHLVDGRLSRESEAYRLTLALFAAFAEEAQRQRSALLVALLPDETDLNRVRGGAAPSYAAIAQDLRRRGLRVIDLADAFARRDPSEPTESYFVEVHYSALGNEIVARATLDELRALRSATARPGPGGGGPRRGAAAGARPAPAAAALEPAHQ